MAVIKLMKIEKEQSLHYLCETQKKTEQSSQQLLYLDQTMSNNFCQIINVFLDITNYVLGMSYNI